MNCKNCQKPLPPRRKLFCCDKCKSKFHHEATYGIRSWLTAGTTGAVGELIAATDLMRRGFAVFRALSPASPCDLVIVHGERALRVEVRTSSTATPNGGYYKKNIRADLLAVVMRPGKVEYKPGLAELFGSDFPDRYHPDPALFPETVH